MQLDNLYLQGTPKIEKYCEGCSIRKSKKPCYAIRDYNGVGHIDVLFLVDSLVWNGFTVINLNSSEEVLFDRYVKPLMKDSSWSILASVKCPDVKEKDMSPANKNSCRNFLNETIKETTPNLIFTCGNLPLQMLLKESGISNKRGTTYYYEEIPVIPLFHPMSVVLEPRHLTLFQQDIFNGYNKYILHDTTPPKVEWKVLDDFIDYDWLISTGNTISIDIETTGLNFLTDKIQTVGISYKEGEQLKQIIIPMFHKEAPQDSGWIPSAIEFLQGVCGNPSNKKILQSAKFDMKFLLGLGIEVVNTYDTKLFSHLCNENLPKSLRDLVARYYPEHLEEL